MTQYLSNAEDAGDDGWTPRDPSTRSPHPMTLALQRMVPMVCAQRILGRMSTVETIALDWDHGFPQSVGKLFVAVVKEEEEGGGPSLRTLESKAACALTSQIETSWYTDIPV